MKTCDFCEATFTPAFSHRRFCTDRCGDLDYCVRRGVYTKQHALELHANKEDRTLVCANCGKSFVPSDRGRRHKYCSSECGTQWRNRKEYARGRQLKYYYGITEDTYNNMLSEQNNLCLLCGTKPDERVLVVDHDHKTGAIRGLLCHTCNLHLGWYEAFKDRAEQYLNRREHVELLGD